MKEVNFWLIHLWDQRNIPYISHCDTTEFKRHLNESKFHLSKYGIIVFAKTFSNYLSGLNWNIEKYVIGPSIISLKNQTAKKENDNNEVLHLPEWSLINSYYEPKSTSQKIQIGCRRANQY